MPLLPMQHVSQIWKEVSFANKLVFCTGDSATICSSQVWALVYVDVGACIVGKRQAHTENVAFENGTARKDSQVLVICDVDVRELETLERAIGICVQELGGIDFVM
jgi:2,4-dienoyl-CoA reductase [(3E)-enoyl-CoA-producing], peroxisomal